MDAWVEQELDGCAFPDQRLKARLGKLLGDLGQRIGGTVPAACQDWAATKAAYRFFDNPRVDEGTILAGHFAATTARFAATAGTVLVLHDTTELSFQRRTPEAIGRLSIVTGPHANWATYHKMLKSGCQAEQARLRTADRLTNLLAVLCVVGWRVFWLTMAARATPDTPPEAVLTAAEIEVLDRMAGGAAPGAEPSSPGTPAPPQTISHYLRAIAKLGGYLGHKNDPPPGNMVVWRGLTRLADIVLGVEMMGPGCG